MKVAIEIKFGTSMHHANDDQKVKIEIRIQKYNIEFQYDTHGTYNIHIPQNIFLICKFSSSLPN